MSTMEVNEINKNYINVKDIEIEYACKMSKKEVDDFHNFLKLKQQQKIETAMVEINKNKETLIKLYQEAETKLSLNLDISKDRYSRALTAYHKKRCLCGSETRIFTNRFNENFNGCVNFSNDKVEHRIYNFLPQDYFLDVFKNWLPNIIRSANLKGKIHAKALLQFYLDNGLSDLQDKHISVSSYEVINRLTDINKSSKEFELRQVDFLRNEWPVVLYQFPIKYRLKEEKKDKYCFIDILCSNDEYVCIYECKTNRHDIYVGQTMLYKKCIEYINKNLNINKTIKIDYLTEYDG